MANPKRIAVWFVAAAVFTSAGAARADLEAGKAAYQRGDYSNAREEMLPLAEAGDADAQVYMGLMQSSGKGVDKDSLAAARWYRAAADQGHADGQFNLGLMYAKGQGVPLNYAAAVRLYTQAAEQGHASAQLNLGVCYSRGYGVLRNEETAAHWFREAAEQNNPAAQFNLGLTYAAGNGAAPDPAQAVEWYTKAAEQGYTPAQLNLGVCYERGRGVPRDLHAAAKWYRLAAASGNKTANDNFARVTTALGESPATVQPAATTREESAAPPVLVESESPEHKPTREPRAPAVDAAAIDSETGVGKIVTRADAVVGEVDTLVADTDEAPSVAADTIADNDEAGETAAAETGDMPAAMGVSVVPQASEVDEMTLAWRRRSALPAAAAPANDDEAPLR